MDARVAVIIPAFNASGTIRTLLSRSRPTISLKNIYVIDDGSRDGTGEAARDEGANVIRLEQNSGKGAALSKGFEILKDNSSYDFVATMDADLQHSPEKLVVFVDEILKADADLVIGHRRIAGSNMPLHRRLSNKVTSFLVSARAGQQIPDSQCGYRLIRRHVLSTITIRSTGFEAETEFLLKAARQKSKIRSVPIETIYGGERSHMTNWKTTVNFIKVLLQDY